MALCSSNYPGYDVQTRERYLGKRALSSRSANLPESRTVSEHRHQIPKRRRREKVNVISSHNPWEAPLATPSIELTDLGMKRRDSDRHLGLRDPWMKWLR